MCKWITSKSWINIKNIKFFVIVKKSTSITPTCFNALLNFFAKVIKVLLLTISALSVSPDLINNFFTQL